MLSFRTRRILRTLGIAAIALVIFTVIGLSCWLLWLNRYIIYTQDGAKLDFDLPPELPMGEPLGGSATRPSMPVIYDDTPPAEGPAASTMPTLNGYYVELGTLVANPAAVRAQVEQLPEGTPVLLELKNYWGVAYYTSSVVTHTDAKKTEVDSLVAWMKDRYYLIASVPAFRDYWYGRENVSHGLPQKGGGGSLWDDDDGCYWLNPGSEGAVRHLIQVAAELKEKGFREVVFSDFRFPSTNEIVFEGDRLATLNQAAAELVHVCAEKDFVVSFQRSDTALTLPDGYTRLYLTGISAADAAAVADAAIVTDSGTQVVFMAKTGDTRYNAFCVLRPISEAIN